MEKLLFPLTEEEFKALEDSIFADGLQDAVKVWINPEDSKCYLVDGHNRYAIMEKYGKRIPDDKITILDDDKYKTKDDVILYMLQYQLGRRNLTPVQKMALVEYHREIFQSRAKENLSSGGKGLSGLTKVNTRKEVSNITGLSEGTIAKYDFVMKTDNQFIRNEMLNEKISINKAYDIVKSDNSEISFNINEYKIIDIPIKHLRPFPQRKKYFEEMFGDEWINFLNSVKENGVIETILISQDMTIVSGHERVRACKDLGIESISCRVKKYINDDGLDFRLMLRDFLTLNLKIRSTDFDIAYQALKANEFK